MENLKKSRSPLRGLFTKTVNELQALFVTENISRRDLNASLANVERRAEQLRELDKQIYDLMMKKDETTEEDFLKELEGCCMYEDKLNHCRCTVEDVLSRLAEKTESESGSVISQGGTKSRRYKLPKIEFIKFGGDIKEWLAFWAQFEKIHKDKDMADEDKFHYLRQSTIENSKAREVVDSFPMTSANYPKVVKHMVDRFGNHDTLVEVYVRELLKLVLSNALNPNKKMVVSTLYDKLEAQLRALESLEVTRDKFAAILFPLVESCLPEELLRAWERHRVVPTVVEIEGMRTDRLTHLMLFLRGEVESEERIMLARSGFAEQVKKVNKKEEKSCDIPTAAGLFVGMSKGKSKCIFCGDNRHFSNKCFTGKKMNMDERRKIIATKKACNTCLGLGHQSKECHLEMKLKCFVCGGNHFQLMCNENGQSMKEVNSISTVGNSTSEHRTTNLLAKPVCNEEVVLSTMMIRVRNGNKSMVIRAAIDSGSHKTYMLKRIITKLGLLKNGQERLCHELFGGHHTKEKIHDRFTVFAENLNGNKSHSFNVLEQDRICYSVPKVRKGPWIEELQRKGIILSDIGVGASEIELLIGSDVAGKLLTELYKFEEDGFGNGLVALNYSIGWAVMGQVSNQSVKNDATLLVHTLFVQEVDLSNLWRLDVIGIEDAAETKKKEKCIETATEHFKKTLAINEEGRYQIALPFIDGYPPVRSNEILSKKRLISMTKKLTPELRVVYQKVFDEWENEGVIEKVPDDELYNKSHYLPHKAVLKPNSQTTPVRPVFDASAKEKNSVSLNDCLERGPNLLEIISSVVSRFRMRKIGVVSDIRKAFLQISIRPEDRDNLRFLWWDKDSKEKIQVYRHRRVVFGMTCSSFLLAATINHILDEAPVEYQDTINQLKNANYVDNCVTSLDDETAVIKFRDESVKILSTGKFDLRGWEWNSPSSIQDKEISVLGMTWNLKEDTLACDIIKTDNLKDGPVSKRIMLAMSHQIYDPIGFTIPLVICPKLYLQECWQLKIGWDEELPEDISIKFRKWCNQLLKVKQVKIPRWLGLSNANLNKTTLHIFSDASKLAYAACVFLRIESENGISTKLIQAKARIAPLKKLSIPRLELLGCLIGTRLSVTIKKDMNIDNVKCYYWTDSINALHWIINDDQWGTYVWNRVTEIRKSTDIHSWKHVPGKLNPADLPSRGCTATQLIESSWWEGPDWLKLPEWQWPSEQVVADEDVLESERKKTVVCAWELGRMKANTSRLVKYSNDYQKMIRFVALVIRICKNVRKSKEDRITGQLSFSELDSAEKRIWVMVQSETFLDNDKDLNEMELFIDEDQILRVKTRILLRQDVESFKAPAVLPGKHPIVKCIIEYYHRKYSHAGTHTLMSILREKFWIIRSRVAVKKVVRRCTICKRYTAKHFETEPAQLPLDRIRDAAVFEITGVDLTGHLFMRDGSKAWIVLYTCAVYRAVHLELVSSLSTEVFIESLRRFINKKNRAKVIYSDNGTNLTGAENSFEGLDWDKIKTAAATNEATKRIDWKFIPSKAPWWGGWWERLIGIIKDSLKRVLGKAKLNFEEMTTVLCDCEDVINSRPLTYLSEDSTDLQTLTPAMFLKDMPEWGVPDLDAVDAESLNKRRRYRQRLRDGLRKRFRTEYIGQLQHRKQGTVTRPIEIGEIVLVSDDKMKRMNWPLARVIGIEPSRDGVNRVAKIKTTKSVLTRPVKKLFPLEIRPDEKILPLDTATTKSLKKELLLIESDVQSQVFTRSGRIVKPVDRLGCNY